MKQKNRTRKKVARKRITPFANALYALDITDDLFIEKYVLISRNYTSNCQKEIYASRYMTKFLVVSLTIDNNIIYQNKQIDLKYAVGKQNIKQLLTTNIPFIDTEQQRSVIV